MSSFVSAMASAGDLHVRVTDSAGRPLRYAAVSATWPGAPPAHADPTQGAPATMAQRDRQFVPHMLMVPQDTSVSFPNRDETRHHVYSFSKAKTFDIKLYVGRPERPIIFDKPGVVTLGCNIHDYMQAFIVVSDDPRRAVTDAAGEAVFKNLPEAPVTLTLWHPWMISETERVERRVAPGTGSVRVVLDVTAPPRPVKDSDSSNLQDQFDLLSQ